MSRHTKLTLVKKFLPPPLPGFELATLRSRVRFSYQQAIPAPLTRHDSFFKTILQVTLEGGQSRGRQKKKRGLDISAHARTAHNDLPQKRPEEDLC